MDDISSATEQPAQEIESRIEEHLFGSDTPDEPTDLTNEEVSKGEEILPEDDDSDSDDKDGSDDLEDIATDEELSLANYLGIEEDKLVVSDDGKVSFNAVIDGETKSVPLEDLAKSFQLQGHVNNKSIALENERKQFQEQQQSVAQELKTRVEGLDGMGKVFEKELVDEYNSIDWDRLRGENPAEWTALRAEYAERAQRVKRMQALVIEENNRLQKDQQTQMQQNHQAHLQDEFGKMLTANPTWTDDTVRAKDLSELRGFVSETYGFTDGDMAAVTDHRLINLIKDAKAYRQGSKAAESKKVKRVPKFQKPGASKANVTKMAKVRATKAKRAAVQNGGHVNDIAKLIEDRM
jgi:hypothetical protein